MAKALFQKLADGNYIARCKEQSILAAALNGHSQVWPEAQVVVKGRLASFFKGGKKVWECNATYARGNFDCTPTPDHNQPRPA